MLVAVSNNFFENGRPVAGQFTGITFYIYDNATHKMKVAYGQDLGFEIDAPEMSHSTLYALPRQGKTIVCTFYTSVNRKEKRMTWNGSKFIPESK